MVWIVMPHGDGVFGGGGGCETTQVITSNRSVNGSGYKATLVNQCHRGNLARSTKSHRELQSGVLKEALKAG